MATLDPEWTVAVPLVASLAGAGPGAHTAQYIAARNKRNDEEVRAAQPATTIAYGITDHFLSMKEQIVKPVVDQFGWVWSGESKGRCLFISSSTCGAGDLRTRYGIKMGALKARLVSETIQPMSGTFAPRMTETLAA